MSNHVRNAVCNAVTRSVRNEPRCWVQNQNQNQSLLVTQFCGVSGQSFHPSHGDLRARMDGRFAAEIGGGR